jgi:hypothetical protein
MERADVTGRIHRRAQACRSHRPIDVVLQVLFARPDQLHGQVRNAGGGHHRLHHHVHLGPPPKAAAQVGRMHDHLFAVDSSRLGGEPFDQGRRLVADPHLA